MRQRIVVAIIMALIRPGLAIAGSETPTSAGSASSIESYQAVAQRIIAETRRHNDAWHKMEQLCDGIGHRLSGSAGLERAVAWALETFKADGQENVHAEPVMVPKWVRGEESLVMVTPRRQNLAMLGLGGSVGTGPEGITAPVLVVKDEEELKAAGDKAKGRIVLFNNRMAAFDPKTNDTGYGSAVKYRHVGAQLVAASGAVACLVRSVTARSLRSPHTGAMSYGDSTRKVPAAAVSTEDADSIARLCAADQTVELTLKMSARTEADAPSANVIAELRGREKPDEVVVIGGHLDSWDVGQGAHDDGAGSVMCMEAINVLRKCKLIPRRTIRVVLFTNEENGTAGGRNYAKVHADEAERHVAAIETDSGAFRPLGFGVDCKDTGRQARAIEQLGGLVPMLSSLGVEKIEGGHSGADVGHMKRNGVLLMGLSVDGATYFDYHHSQADTLDKVDPALLSDCVAAMAVTAYVIADMPVRLGD